MDWEKKVEMVKVGNATDFSNNDQHNKFIEVVSPLIEDFDVMCVSMFINISVLTSEVINHNKDFYKKFLDKSNSLDISELPMRDHIRIEALNLILQEVNEPT